MGSITCWGLVGNIRKYVIIRGYVAIIVADSLLTTSQYKHPFLRFFTAHSENPFLANYFLVALAS